jgi:type IV pilus assembly protein PilC
MPKFIYKARDREGQPLSGVLDAKSRMDLRSSLSKKGYYVVDIKEERPEGKVTFFLSNKINLDSVAVFCHQFYAMINAGIPIIRCLDIIWKQTEDRKLQIVVSKIKNELLRGSSLSDALGKFPDVFPPMFYSLIRVGESGAGLSDVLQHLAFYFTKQRDLIQKVKGAFIYPIIILFLAIVVVIIIMVVVVPVFHTIYMQMHASLPLPTQILIFASALLKRTWWAIPFVVIGSGIAYNRAYHTKRGRSVIDRIKLKIPLFGPLYFKICMYRFVRAFSLLISSGVPITQVLELSKEVSDNSVIEEALTDVEDRIGKGSSIAAPLDEKGIFPPMLTQMVAVGEESGTLSEMLDSLGTHMESDLDHSLKRMTTVLEPLMIVIIGVLVAFILMSIYFPIFTIWRKIRTI